MPGDTSAPSPRRDRTRTALLAAIGAGSGVTRAELARSTGLSSSAVASGVKDLLAAGSVVEREVVDAVGHAGRRPGRLHVRRPQGFLVGIDLGHTHIRAAIGTTDGAVLVEELRGVDLGGDAGAALDATVDLVETMLRLAGIARTSVAGVGVGIPGPLDHAGLVGAPTILSSWIGLRPAEELRRRLGLPVRARNDADLGALGEQREGSGRPFSDLLYVKASHGIGASLILRGSLYDGALGAVGEIGHSHLAGAVNRCRCGKQGCLEAAVGVDEVRRQLDQTHLRRAPGERGLSLREAGSDPAGANILSDAGRVVGEVVAQGCNWLNPQAVILGGELGTSGPSFVEGVRESLNRYAERAVARSVVVLPAALGERSEVVGALALAAEGVGEVPSVRNGASREH